MLTKVIAEAKLYALNTTFLLNAYCKIADHSFRQEKPVKIKLTNKTSEICIEKKIVGSTDRSQNEIDTYLK